MYFENGLHNGCPQIMQSGSLSMSNVRFPTRGILEDAAAADRPNCGPPRPPTVSRREPDDSRKCKSRNSSLRKSETRKTHFGGQSCAPSLWSCGFAVGVIFCLMNKEVNAYPVQEFQIEKRNERSRRSASSEDFLDELATDWFLRRFLDRKGATRSFKTRNVRSTGEQILNEMEYQWIMDAQSEAAAKPSIARQRRSFSDQILADIQAEMASDNSALDVARQRRSTELILNQLDAEWQEKQSQNNAARSANTRIARSISDQILNELEAQWHDKKMLSDAEHPKGARQARSISDQIISEMEDDWYKNSSPVATNPTSARRRRSTELLINEFDKQHQESTSSTPTSARRRRAKELILNELRSRSFENDVGKKAQTRRTKRSENAEDPAFMISVTEAAAPIARSRSSFLAKLGRGRGQRRKGEGEASEEDLVEF